MPRYDSELAVVLARLARAPVERPDDLDAVLRRLTRTAAHGLCVERVNIWLLEAGDSRLRCLDNYQTTRAEHSAGDVLHANDYPAYFAALHQLRTIAASDARTDPITFELTDSYLRRHGITTILDAPIYRSGTLVGVVCHEHTGLPRIWTAEEKAFAASVADHASIALETYHRARAERATRDREAVLRAVAEQMPDALFLLEQTTGGILFANDVVGRWLGVPPEQLPGRPFAQWLHTPDAWPRSSPHWHDGSPFEVELRSATGQVLPVEWTARVVDGGCKRVLVLVGRDLTVRRAAEVERLAMQAKLMEAERLESLGVFAAGVAHDFNNLLVVVRGRTALARRQAHDPDALQHHLHEADQATHQASGLCRALLDYARAADQPPEAVDLLHLAEEMARLVRGSLPSQVEVQIQAQPDVPRAWADRLQMQRVLINLLTNAGDAIGAHPGIITVSGAVQTVPPGQLYAEVGQLVVPGTYVGLCVRDTGCGMSATVQKRLFEPFFTTKPTGHGLGMAAVAGIVRHHGGCITVSSSVGVGSTITVWLPTAPA
jgi:PAS domain S-box-containing protein